jgi:hypothetical protein
MKNNKKPPIDPNDMSLYEQHLAEWKEHFGITDPEEVKKVDNLLDNHKDALRRLRTQYKQANNIKH